MSQSETKTMPEAVEFTVIACQDKTYQAFEYRKSHDQLVNTIHVISYSAYSALKAECEKLQMEVDVLKGEKAHDWECIDIHYKSKITALTNAITEGSRNLDTKDKQIELLTTKLAEQSENAALVAENSDFRTAIELLLPEIYCLMIQKKKPKRLEDLPKDSGSVAFAYHTAREMLSKHEKKEMG